MASGTEEEERFRSFAERYVIERARNPLLDDPLKEGWQNIQHAISLYKQIAIQAHGVADGLRPECLASWLGSSRRPRFAHHPRAAVHPALGYGWTEKTIGDGVPDQSGPL